MNNDGQKLLRMKEHIEQSKTEAARIEGQIQALKNQRITELGVGTDAEAAEYILELKQDIAALEKELQSGIQTLERELGWTT